MFDELEQYAKSVNVPRDKFAKRDVTISLRTNTNNFYALQANADTKEFYKEQTKKINDAIVPPPTPPTPPDDEDPPLPPTPRIRKVVHLNTQTSVPMHTEADIDLYLQGLKAELMQHLGDDIDIIIN